MATALFTVLNVAANGYNLVPISTTNPNETLANHTTWFQNWPAFLVSNKPDCDDTNLALSNFVHTNNSGLNYRLESAWQLDNDGNTMNQGSVAYRNNELQDCNVSRVDIEIQSDDRTAGQIFLQPVGAILNAFVYCRIPRPEGDVYIQLTAAFDSIQGLNEPQSPFVKAPQDKASTLFWGAALLQMYWHVTLLEYYGDIQGTENPYYKAVIHLDQNQTATPDVLMSMDFHTVQCFLIRLNTTWISTSWDATPDSATAGSLATNTEYVPSIWQSVDVLGKAMWFTVLADLGRDDSTIPNMLGRPQLLENLTKNLTKVSTVLDESGWNWGLTTRSDQPFVAAGFGKEAPSVGPSVFAASYVCRVLQRESGGSLFVSVLIADLVLMQALWTLFTLTVDAFLVPKNEQWQRLGWRRKKAQIASQGDQINLLPRATASQEEGGARGVVDGDATDRDAIDGNANKVSH